MPRAGRAAKISPRPAVQDDSICLPPNTAGVFWRRMSFGACSAGALPGPDFCFIDASGGDDEPEIPHRRNRQFAVTVSPDEPEPPFSKRLISPQVLAPYNPGRPYRKLGRRTVPRASHRIEGSVSGYPRLGVDRLRGNVRDESGYRRCKRHGARSYKSQFFHSRVAPLDWSQPPATCPI